jgi:hypothetical protein
MRDVLLHLERAGFDAAPRWLGFDERGRDVLTWIGGETFTDRGQMHPYIGDPPARITFTDEQIGAVMRLLRRYHARRVERRIGQQAPALHLDQAVGPPMCVMRTSVMRFVDRRL